MNPLTDTRLPPQNIEAEEQILASCFINIESLNEATDFLIAEDFYRTAHKTIFSVMADLVYEKVPVDLVTVMTRLRDNGCLDEIGGASYLSRIIDEVPPAANVRAHCEIVKGDATKRNLIIQANAIIKDCYSGEPAPHVLDKSQERVFGIEFEPTQKTTHYLKDLVITRLEHFEELAKNNGELTGVPTGIIELDKLTCGLQPTDLIYLAARPGVGKSAFALDISRNAAKRGFPGLIFSLEMSKEQLTDRSISAEAKVDGHKIRAGKLSQEDWSKVSDASGVIYNLPIGIDDTGGLTLAEIRRRARKSKKAEDIQWIIIDYLQLMFTEKGHSRDREIGIVSAGLKALAKELKIPIVVLSQLNRGLENRENKRPRLADLRESGNLEQDADVVIFLYRPAIYNEEEDFDGQSEIILAKQRSGPAGKSIKVIFFEEYTCFENYTHIYE